MKFPWHYQYIKREEFAVITSSVKMRLKDLPKVELHLHLDCSLSYELVSRLKPGTSMATYRELFVAPPKCHDLADYILRAISAIELMQTEENLRLTVLDLFEQLLADHVIYAEMRFAPMEHLRKGLTPAQVVAAVNRAVEESIQSTGIQAGVILCTLRHYSKEQSMETVQLVKQFRGTRVVGFDIASDEAGYPIDNHIDAFQYAREYNLNCTAHAGEACGPESVWETLENFGPTRIGHGVRSGEDTKLLQFLKEKKIHLEVCPTSNVQTGIFPHFRNHNIDRLYNSGISLSVNTDCRTISDATLSGEYNNLQQAFGWSKRHFLRCNQEAITHAFTSNEVKKQLMKKLTQGFNA